MENGKWKMENGKCSTTPRETISILYTIPAPIESGIKMAFPV
jgi:hypothetical protein